MHGVGRGARRRGTAWNDHARGNVFPLSTTTLAALHHSTISSSCPEIVAIPKQCGSQHHLRSVSATAGPIYRLPLQENNLHLVTNRMLKLYSAWGTTGSISSQDGLSDGQSYFCMFLTKRFFISPDGRYYTWPMIAYELADVHCRCLDRLGCLIPQSFCSQLPHASLCSHPRWVFPTQHFPIARSRVDAGVINDAAVQPNLKWHGNRRFPRYFVLDPSLSYEQAPCWTSSLHSLNDDAARISFSGCLRAAWCEWTSPIYDRGPFV